MSEKEAMAKEDASRMQSAQACLSLSTKPAQIDSLIVNKKSS